MKNLAKIAFFCAGGIAIAGCVEEDIYYGDPAPSGYSSSYQTDMTSGYNRDYNHHSHSRRASYSSSPGSGYQTYSSPSNASAYSSSAPSSPAYEASGYSSSRSPVNYPGSGYSSSQPPSHNSSGGYSSSRSPASYPSNSSGGYSSSNSSANIQTNNGGYSSSGSNAPVNTHPMAGRGHGLFGKAAGNLPRKMVPAEQEDSSVPSGNTGNTGNTSSSGWSSSAGG